MGHRRDQRLHAAQSIDLIDDYHIDTPLADIGEKLGEGGPVEAGTREAAVIVMSRDEPPALMSLAGDIGRTGFALGIEGVIRIPGGRRSRQNICCGQHCCRLFSQCARNDS